MEKEKFEKQLREATIEVVNFTLRYCSNELCENYEYVIVPNVRDKSGHLNKEELKTLSLWNKKQNKRLPFEQVINLLYNNGRVPLWINITVYQSLGSMTVIELLCSRRLREEQELMHKDKIPPFNILISLPPAYNGVQDVKFDVNWRTKGGNIKFQMLMNWIKSLF